MLQKRPTHLKSVNGFLFSIVAKTVSSYVVFLFIRPALCGQWLCRLNHSDDHGRVALGSAGTNGHGDIGKHLRTVGARLGTLAALLIEGYIK